MPLSDAPQPLVPAEVDLRDFAFMPLDVRRLRDSRLIATRTPEECLGAIILWSASWHQVPASSLPDDDAELAQLAGYGRSISDFTAIKDGALHGLVRCTDGRFYHPVVAEKAAEAWNGRLDLEHKRASDRMRKQNKERTEQGLTPLPMPAQPELLSMRLVDGSPTWRCWNSAAAGGGIPPEGTRKSRLKGKGKGERKGQGKGKEIFSSEANASSVPVASGVVVPLLNPATATNGVTPGAVVWNAYAAAYRIRYGVVPEPNAKIRAQCKQFAENVPAVEAPDIATWFVQSNEAFYLRRKHDIGQLLADAPKLRTEWLTRRHATETEARQADRTAATGNVFRNLIEEFHGSDKNAA